MRRDRGSKAAGPGGEGPAAGTGTAGAAPQLDRCSQCGSILIHTISKAAFLCQACRGIHSDQPKVADLEQQIERLQRALKKHHDWQLAQTEPGEHGIVLADAYAESELCEETTAALSR
jgi:hypothetical protein